MLRIDDEVIDVVPSGQPRQTTNLDRPQHLDRGRQAADHHRIGPEQSIAPIPVIELLALNDADGAVQGLQLLPLLFHPVQKTLGQVITGQQQPMPIGR